jgi:hypothetical protein
MPISLGQLTANRKALTIPFEGVGELHVEYYPQRLTAKMLTDFATADKLADLPAERVVEIVSSPVESLLVLLHSWDMTATDDGPVLPIDRETLSGLGLQILWAIVAGIMSDGGRAGEASAPEGSAKKRHSGATS